MTNRPGHENRPSSFAKKAEDMSRRATLEDSLAHQVHATYVAERRAYESFLTEDISKFAGRRLTNKSAWDAVPEYPEAHEKADVWVKMTRTLLQMNRDPCDYVRKVFSGLAAVSGNIPNPGQLMSAACEKLYQRAKKELRREIKIAFMAQKQKARARISGLQRLCELSMDQATIEVLCDRSIGLSALFRYCLAFGMGNRSNFPKIMARFRVQAAIQYIHNKAHYDAVWKDWIPKKFPGIARRIYDAWISQLTGETTGGDDGEE